MPFFLAKAANHQLDGKATMSADPRDLKDTLADFSEDQIADELRRRRRERMDPAAMRWMEQVKLLRDNAPIFVAAPAEKLYDDLAAPLINSRHVMYGLCEVVEAAVHFLTLTGLAALVHRDGGTLPKNVRDALAPEMWSPTFGKWFGALGMVADELREETGALARTITSARAALDVLFRGQEDDKFSASGSQLTNILTPRNALAHASGASSELLTRLANSWGPRVGAVLEELGFLREVLLWAGDPSGPRLFRGASPHGVGPDHALTPPADLRSGEVAVTNGSDAVWLAPFGRRAPGGVGDRDVAQLFMRRTKSYLVYGLVGSDVWLQGKSNAAEARRFADLFAPPVAEQQDNTKGLLEGSFEPQIAKEARNFAGRQDDLAVLLEAIRQTRSGTIWIQGQAGIGKSALLGRTAVDLEAAARAGGWWLRTYRFRNSAIRCASAPFYRWLIERLAPAEAHEIIQTTQNRPSDLLDRAADILKQGGRRIILFLDGLDEIERNEPGFARRALAKLGGHADVLLVVSGRPESGLPALMDECGAFRPFPDGLRLMSETDLRAIIDHQEPQMTRAFIRADIGEGEPRNRFMERLLEKSKGLPVYLTPLLHDFYRGAITSIDGLAADKLPSDVVSYYDRLLSHDPANRLSRYRNFVLCILAFGQEPLTLDLIATLVRPLVDGGDQHLKDVEDLLNDLGGYLNADEGTDGRLAWSLYHQAFQEYLLTSDSIAVERQLVFNALDVAGRNPNDPISASYLLRTAARHLIRGGKAVAAAELLSEIRYQVYRLTTLSPGGGDGGIRADWDRIAASGVEISRPAADWQNFWRDDGGRFVDHKLALQPRDFIECALTYAPGTTVGAAVDKLDLAAYEPMVTFAPRLRGRSVRRSTLWGHSNVVIDAAELPGGHIASWAFDDTIRLWTLSGEPFGKVMFLPDREVFNLLALKSGRLVSLSRQKWDPNSLSHKNRSAFAIWESDGTPITPPVETFGDLVGGVEVDGGEFLTYTRSRRHVTDPEDNNVAAIRRWTATGEHVADLTGPADDVLILRDQRVLLARGNALTIHGAKGLQVGAAIHVDASRLDRFGKIDLYNSRGLTDGRILLVWNDNCIELLSRDGVSLARATLPRSPSLVTEFPGRGVATWVGPAGLVATGNEGLMLWDYELKPTRLSIGSTALRYFVRAVTPLNDGGICVFVTNEGRGALNFLDRNGIETGRIDLPGEIVRAGQRTLAGGDLLYWLDNVLHIVDPNNPPDAAAVAFMSKELSQWSANGASTQHRNAPSSAQTAIKDLGFSDKRNMLAKVVRAGWRLGKLATAVARDVTTHDRDVRTGLLGKERARRSLQLQNGRYLVWEGVKLQLVSSYDSLVADLGGVASGAIAFGRDRFMTWSGDTCDVWDINGTPLFENIKAHAARVNSVIELSDGRLVSASDDQTIRLWSPDGRPFGEPIGGHEAGVVGLAELPDGRFISWSADRVIIVRSPAGTAMRRHLYWYGMPRPGGEPLTFRTDVSPESEVRCTVH